MILVRMMVLVFFLIILNSNLIFSHLEFDNKVINFIADTNGQFYEADTLIQNLANQYPNIENDQNKF